MSFSIIAAIGKNNELGKDNDLIWHLPRDLQFFKDMTMNKTIVMGYNTYLSLPKKLKGRKYVVLSSRKPNLEKEVEVYENYEDLLNALVPRDEEIFIIGGASIYKLLIDKCDKLYLTEIDAMNSQADVYFPRFNKDNYISEKIDENEENGIKYKHMIYRRK